MAQRRRSIWDDVDDLLAHPPAPVVPAAPRPPSIWDEVDEVLASPPQPKPAFTPEEIRPVASHALEPLTLAPVASHRQPPPERPLPPDPIEAARAATDPYFAEQALAASYARLRKRYPTLPATTVRVDPSLKDESIDAYFDDVKISVDPAITGDPDYLDTVLFHELTHAGGAEEDTARQLEGLHKTGVVSRPVPSHEPTPPTAGVGQWAGKTFLPAMPPPEHAKIGPAPTEPPLDFVDYFTHLITSEGGDTRLSATGEAMIPIVGPVKQGIDAVEVIRAARRVRDDQGTPADDQILEKYLAKDAEATKRGTTLGYDIASIAAQMPAFAVEFGMTGGVFEGVQALITRAGAKLATRRAGQLAVKGASYAAGAAAQELAMPQRIAAEALHRNLPTPKKEGTVTDLLSDWDDDFAAALAKAVPDQFVEVFSERTGGVLDKIPVPKRLAALKVAVLEQWLKLHPSQTMIDALAKVRSATAWDGLLGEVFEERVGEVMRAAQPYLKQKGQPDPAMIRIATGAPTQDTKPGESPRIQAVREFGYQLMTEAAGFALPGAVGTVLEYAARETPDPTRGRVGRNVLDSALARGSSGFNQPPPAAGEPPPPGQPPEPPPPVPPSAAPGVSFMITKAQEAELRARGYDDAAIDQMTPEAAHAILAAPPAVPTGSAPVPEPPAPPPTKKPVEEMTSAELAAELMAEFAAEQEGAAPPAEPHKFSSTQVNLPPEAAAPILALAAQIPDADLAKDGRETTPHITVKYGLHGTDADAVRAVLADEPPITVTLGSTSFFPNSESDNGDVVKVDVDSPDLHRLNKKIADALEHTDTHPTYQPHATIAYVKPGKGKQYAGNDALKGQTVTLSSISFTSKDGTVTDIPLGGGPNAAQARPQPEGDLGEHRRTDQEVPAEAGGGDRPAQRGGVEETGAQAQVTGPAEPESRASVIDRIVEASHKPEPDIVERFERKGTDGKWYDSRANSFPVGVRATEEMRSTGFAILTRDNTTVGKREPTREALLERWRAAQARDDADFRSHLEQEPLDRLQAQAAFWLKTAAPTAISEVSSGGAARVPKTPTTPAGSQPGSRPGERPETPESRAESRRVREEGARERARLKATEDADGLDTLVATARAGGFTGDETALRAALADRLALLHELDAEFDNSGHNPLVLLREIARLGGLSITAETGVKGELERLKQFQDNFGTALRPKTAFGYIRGVKGVLNERGLSVDDMLTQLHQDNRFDYIETLSDFLVEIEAAASAEHVGVAIARLQKGLGEKWWNTLNLTVAEPTEDTTATEGDDTFDTEALDRPASADAIARATVLAASRGEVTAGHRAAFAWYGPNGEDVVQIIQPINVPFVRVDADGSVTNHPPIAPGPTAGWNDKPAQPPAPTPLLDTPVDILDTGEAQTRLPETEGARRPGVAPTFKAPVQASGEDFSLGGPPPPPPAGPGLFEGAAPPAETAAAADRKAKIAALKEKLKAEKPTEPQRARTAEGNVRAGIGDEGAAARIMASSLYQKNITEVATKELLQNALDAVRGKGDEGQVIVRLKLDGTRKYVEVDDNGPGMTRAEIETVFTDLFSSGKRDEAGASGGFGVAKASFLLGGTGVEMESVVATREKSIMGLGPVKKMRYALTGTPEELTSATGIKIEVTQAPNDTPTGTRVRTYLPDKAEGYEARQFIQSLTEHSTGLAGTLEMYEGETSQRARFASTPTTRARGKDWPAHHVTVMGAKLVIREAPEDRAHRTTSVAIRVLNHGVYQLDDAVSTAPPESWRGPELVLPDHVTVDVQATVAEGDPAYPFTANREKLRHDFEKDMEQAVYNTVIKHRAEKASTLLQDTYDRLPTIDLGPDLIDRDIVLLDSGKRLTDAEVDRLFAKPGVQRAARATLRVLDRVITKLLGDNEGEIERMGILLDENTHGVYIPNPKKNDRATILINIFQHLLADATPDAAAAAVWHTAVHEAVHYWISGHDENFTVTLMQKFHELGARMNIEALQELEEAYGDPAHPDQLSRDVSDALPGYQESRRREVVEEDPLSGTSRHSKGPADERGRPGRGLGDRGPDRSGTTPNLTPETIAAMIDIVRGYIADDITDFPTVARTFQEEWGEGSRALDRFLELAWRRLRGETVSVASALAEAQNRPEAHGGPTVDRPGRLGDARGPPADTVRVEGEGTLGAVPPEDRGVAPPVGPAGVGPGDSEGVPPDGLSDRPAHGAGAGTAPGSGGAAVPRPALSPSGASSDPGRSSRDYDLTPARIAAIINRTDMPRAQDNLAALRLIKLLETEHRYATPDEQDVLAKYVGWGATEMAAFLQESPDYDWSKPKKQLWHEIRNETTPEQREALRASSKNAHFTYDLYGPIWAALERAGFTGGHVLEPAVGTGHAFGLMPAEIRANSTLNATELEPITAAIAQALYPSARVQTSGYEQARIARNTQDLILSNVPFGKYGVIDRLLPEFITKRIHNYFFGKALEHARPGGFVVFVTSRYTMDGPETLVARRYLMDRAHFVGAVRLPNVAFDKTAKTEVVTDLIVLQKFQEGESQARNKDLFIQSPPVPAFTWKTTERVKGKTVETEHRTYRSSWYTAHPELLLGAESMSGKMRGQPGTEYTLGPKTKDMDVKAALQTALEQILPPGTYTDSLSAPVVTRDVVKGRINPGEYRIGSNGQILQVNRHGELVPAPMTKGVAAIVTKSIGIRDALRETVRLMRSTEASDDQIAKAQRTLTSRYKAFVGIHGRLNDRTNRVAFKDDPEAANLLGLEIIKPRATITKNKAGKETLRITYQVVEHVERKGTDGKWHDAEAPLPTGVQATGETRSTGGLADIFTKRTLHAYKEIDHADTPQDALLASLGSRAKIDWPYMATIYSGEASTENVAALQAKLVAEGRVFKTPDGTWVLADEYLSGDVVSKLEDAEAAEADHPGEFTANVAALTAVKPAPKTDEDLITGVVAITLGSHWVDPRDIEQFVQDELQLGEGGAAEIRVGLDSTETFVRWNITWGGRAVSKSATHSLAVKYGASDEHSYGFDEMFEDALNLNQPSLGYYVGRGKNRTYVHDAEGTLAAKANIEELRNKWLQWLYEHPDVMTRLLATFNERYNRTVTRVYDGSHLANIVDWNAETKSGTRTAALPGLSLPFPLFPHQLRAVWRGLTTGNTLLAHAVGAGKTFEGIVLAMEMRRTGRAKKPMITVPTHLLPQWRADILKAYPDAKILAFDEKDLAADRRQQAMARIAFGDWDIVLVPHSSFQLLKISDQRMIDTMQEWIDELVSAEAEARADRGARDPNVKKLAAQRAAIEGKVARKLASMNKSQDNNLVWEDLGVDALIVDEAHAFKNLFFFSKIDNMRGLSRSEADKSLDLFIKVKDINEQSRYRNLVLATATPVMNSMAEVFTMQRYLQPQRLRELGFENFDHWYAMFAHAVAAPEQQPDGSYKEVMRLRKFRNLDLLYRVFADVMDYIDIEDMPYLKLPKLLDNKVTVLKTPKHPMYPQLQRWFSDRMANIRAMPPHVNHAGVYIAPVRPDPLTGEPIVETNPKRLEKGYPYKQDNILTIMNDARLAAIDVRLVLGNRATDVPGSRLQAAARKMVEYYRREADKKGVALVFLDVGTPKNPQPLEFLRGVTIDDTTDGAALGVEDELADEDELVGVEDDGSDVFNLYDALKAILVGHGIPSREIAYIHQARNSAERLALFEAAQTGKIRFLFASTDKGGVGMNIQNQLGLMVEMDAPRMMRPGDIIQRIGRIIRQGNSYETAQILRMVTEGTTDEWLYGALNDKANMTRQFMLGKATTFEEDDPSTRSIEEAQVMASGDKRAIELINLRTQLPRIGAQAIAQTRAKANANTNADFHRRRNRAYAASLAHVEAWLPTWTDLKGDAFTMRVGEVDFTERVDANKALLEKIRDIFSRRQAYSQHIGLIGGLRVDAEWRPGRYKDSPGRVTVDLDENPLGEGTARVAEIEDVEGLPFGSGRNLVQSITDRYARLPGLVRSYTQGIADGEESIRQSEAVAARPSDAVEKAQVMRDRILELETVLKAESAAREAREDAERKAKAEAKAEKEKEEAAKKKAEGGSPSGGGTEASAGTFNPSIPVTPGSITQINPISSIPLLVELAQELSQTPKVVKGFRGNAKHGTFASGSGLIRLHKDLLKTKNLHQLAATLAHEIGHLIDWLPSKTLKRGNLIGRLYSLHSYLKGTFVNPDGVTIKNKVVRAELLALSDLWRPWDPATASPGFKAYRHSSKELFADAISVLLNNPGLLESAAPTFYKEFFAGLDAKPKAKEAYFAIQALMAGTPEALIAHGRKRVNEMFTLGDTKAIELEKIRQAELAAGEKDLALRFRIQMVDKNMAVIDRVRDLEKLGIHINPDDDPRYFLEERNYLGGLLKAFTTRHFQPLYEQMKAADIDWRTFGEALLYERITEGDRSEIANPNGITPDDAKAWYADLKEQLTPDQRRALASAIADFRTAVRQVAEDAHVAGLYTDEAYAEMKKNPAYATYRVIEHLEDNVSSRVYHQIGTLKGVQNLADATMLKVLATIRAIEQNKMKRAVFDFLEQHDPKAIAPAREIWTGKGLRPVEAKDTKKLKLITYYERGRLRGKYVDPYIASSLTNESIGANFAVVSALRFVNGRVFRPLFTTYNPGFQTFNLFRDFFRTWKNLDLERVRTGRPNITLREVAQRYWEAKTFARVRAFGLPENPTPAQLAAHEDVLQAEEAKILSVTLNDLNHGRDVEDTQVEDTLAKMGVGGFGITAKGSPLTRPVRQFFDWIKKVSDFNETLSKAAGLYELKGAGEIRDIPADLRSLVRRKIGSPDFLAGGTWKPLTNEIFLFSNAITQAVRADLEVATTPTTATGFWWKTAKLNLVPKLVQFAAIYGLAWLGTGGGDDDKDPAEPEDWLSYIRRLYGGMTEYDLTNYTNVPIWLDEKGQSVYVRLPQDDFGRLIGGLTWKLLGFARGDRDVVKAAMEVFSYMSGQAPTVTPTLGAVADAAQIAAGRNVYDAYRGQLVFTRDEIQARNLDTAKKFFGYEFQQLGGSVVWKFYPGEQRPVERTTGQVILDSPIVTNIVGRWVRITDYGHREAFRAVQDQVDRDESRERLEVDKAVNAAIRQFRSLDPAERTPGQQIIMAQQIAQDLFGTGPDADLPEHTRDMIKKLRMGLLRGKADPLATAVMSARTTDQKVALILRGKAEMPPPLFDIWLQTAFSEGVISGPTRIGVMRALPSAQVPVPAP